MTDNGSCYQSKTFRAACKRRGLRQIFTKPYTPKTNGKAERFIQTALREWAYARAYHNSDQRSFELLHWLHRYNWHRPHGSLKANTPISRLGLSEHNLLRLHTKLAPGSSFFPQQRLQRAAQQLAQGGGDSLPVIGLAVLEPTETFHQVNRGVGLNWKNARPTLERLAPPRGISGAPLPKGGRFLSHGPSRST